jgi:hypothetical protein
MGAQSLCRSDARARVDFTWSSWKRPPGRTILGGMTEPIPPPYELVVRACTIHAGRYRWDIRVSGTPVQSSIESFASPQEAHADGRQVIEKLMRVAGSGP